MNALEWNKIIAALLLGLLLYKGIQIIAEEAFESAGPETKAYAVQGLEAEEPQLAVAAVEEVAAPAEDIMALLAAASPEQGQRVFRRCQACHDLSQSGGHKIGPNLYGVIGAPVARHADFRYSDALAGQGGNWDFALMNDYLLSPAEAIPGNKMSFGGLPKAGERAALIVYLNSKSSSPLPLPEVAAPAPTPAAPAAEAPKPAISETEPEATDEAVEKSTPEAAAEAVEEPAPEAVEEAVEESAPEAEPEAVQEAVEESTPEAAAEAVEEPAPEAVEGAVEESTPEPDKAEPDPDDAEPVEGDGADAGGE